VAECDRTDVHGPNRPALGTKPPRPKGPAAFFWVAGVPLFRSAQASSRALGAPRLGSRSPALPAIEGKLMRAGRASG